MKPLGMGNTARALGVLLGCLAMWVVSSVGAHSTLVIGTLSFTPDPVGGAPELVARLVLEDPGLVEVEDAVLFLEFRRLDGAAAAPAANAQPETEPSFVSDQLPEVEPGTYEIRVPTPEPGTYVLSIRDKTYRQEEAVTNLVVPFAANSAVGEHPFVLPPTATGPTSLGTWLVWLIGVPIVAGAIVTFLVLRGGRQDDGEELAGANEVQ